MKLTININIAPGSDFQKEFLDDSLRLMLKAWATYGRNAHKKNKIRGTIETEGEPKDVI